MRRVDRRKLSTQCLPLGCRRATARYSSISSNVFGPEEKKRFNSVPTRPKITQGFHAGLPVEYASQTPICCGDVDIQCGSIHPMNNCVMCIPPGWTMTFWKCNCWCQHTCLVITNSCMYTDRWTYAMPISSSDLCMYVSVVTMVYGCEGGVSIKGPNM